DVVTLVNGEDLLRFVDDAQLRVRGLATSFYVGPHRDSVSAWDEMLGNVRTILDGWLEVQNRWNHIAPLFGAQAFDEQLPEEGARFEEVTVEWRAVQALVRRHCKVSELTRHTNLAAQLANMSRKLEGVARGVMEYLDVKRAGFPRFYFLGNLEMVEMMVGSHDPAAVEAFLPKCFPGVRKVGCVRALPSRAANGGSATAESMSEAYSEAMSRSAVLPRSTPPPPGGLPGLAAFLPGYGLAVGGDAATRRVWGGPRIESLISNESEVLPLRTVVELQDSRTGKKADVEVWMSELERQMRGSLKEMLRFALEATSLQPFSAWLLAWPAQCLLACTSINWCRDIHDIYQAGAPFSTPLRRLEELHRSQIHTVVDLLLGGTLSPVQRGIMENMILTKVYHNEVTARLRERRLDNDSDFEWLKVLRFYLEGPECIAHCGYTSYPYGYEYLGNSPRLVITPLTERAFSSMMAAVHLHYGGAPEGPAGTGKTETVKELAKCLGKQCVVFNTTEQLESGHLTRLLMGIISTGAWACFDEFNRMDMEVLSVVAKQIMVIQTALAAGQRYTVFEGRTMYVNSSLAMFVTMNPMYEHRSVLPSNLKARRAWGEGLGLRSLFRPVAMMVPDYTMIAEVSLYAAGFQSAQMLATKLVSCLKIAADRLSAQQHYDFQMRTLKSVLLIAAQL
ncbi:dynein heavy chain, partial [Volvox carteri f. nagariensis]